MLSYKRLQLVFQALRAQESTNSNPSQDFKATVLDLQKNILKTPDLLKGNEKKNMS